MPLSKKGRYVRCVDCGCRLEMNGVCKICGHTDEPLLPGMVPDLVGLTQAAASIKLIDPECQLRLGNVTEANDESIPVGAIISSDPAAGTELATGAPIAIVISLGPAG